MCTLCLVTLSTQHTLGKVHNFEVFFEVFVYLFGFFSSCCRFLFAFAFKACDGARVA